MLSFLFPRIFQIVLNPQKKKKKNSSDESSAASYSDPTQNIVYQSFTVCLSY